MALKKKRWKKIHLITENKTEHIVNVRTLEADIAMLKVLIYVFIKKNSFMKLCLHLLPALYQAQF